MVVESPTNVVSLMSGAVAGLAVDLTLFPLDTIKTRLQSEQGFLKAGGFRGIYAGIPAVSIGSAPGSALFFITYENAKKYFDARFENKLFSNVAAACTGEMIACLIRVPTEVFKQRAQASPGMRLHNLVVHSFANEGLRGFYRGYWITVTRELPFSSIELPLWEYLKREWTAMQNAPVSAVQGAACGSMAGAVAAGITTPLDVAKTRIMLSYKIGRDRLTVVSVLKDIYAVRGVRGLFAGVTPRVIWMAVGGFVWFGAYEKAKQLFYEWSLATDEGAYVRSGTDIGWGERYRDVVYTGFRSLMVSLFGKKKNEVDTFDEAIAEALKVQEKRKAAVEKAKEEKAS